LIVLLISRVGRTCSETAALQNQARLSAAQLAATADFQLTEVSHTLVWDVGAAHE